MSSLRKTYHSVAIDILGYSLASSPSTSSYSFNALSSWLSKTLNALEINSYHLVGFSAGACLAAYHSASNTKQVQSLTMLAFPDLFYPKEQMYKNAFDHCKFRYVNSISEIDYLWQEQFYSAPALPSTLKKAMLKQYKEQKPLMMHVLSALSDGTGLLIPRLSKIVCASQLIRGKQDRLSSLETYELLDRSIPNVKLIEVDKAGHLAYLEQQVAISKQIHQLIAGSSISSKTLTLESM